MDPDAAGDACSSLEPFEADDPTDELLGDRFSGDAGEPWPTGTRLRDRYELLEVIGSGGTGIVYGALDHGTTPAIDPGMPVAIKLIHPRSRDHAAATVRLKLEFRRLASLVHPGIVRALDIDCDGEHWFIVMERLQGESLQQTLKRHRATGIERAPAIADACIAALAHAHGRGIVHGDVKPANIFLCSDGTVRVLDFSAQIATESGLLRPIATRAYASPQVLAGLPAVAADDIFSLACVIYEMTTGRHPFARCASTAARNAGLHASMPAGMSEPNWQTLRRALAWESAARPPDIRRLPGTAPSRASIAAPAFVPPVPARRSRAPALWLLGLASATAAAAWVSLNQPDSLERRSPFATPLVAAPVAATAVPDSDRAKASPTTVDAGEVTRRASEADSRTARAAVGFDDRTLRISERTHMAALTLRRLDSSRRRVDITWKIRPGAASQGRDFDFPRTGLATLARDQSRRTLYIPIVDDSDREATESFTVQLEATASGTATMQSDRVTVVIVDDD